MVVPRRNLRRVFQSTPPARGATWLSVRLVALVRCFNPRPPHGGRPALAADDSQTISFNPRPPHGGRHSALRLPGDQGCFNPRPPHGGRRINCRIPYLVSSFNPRPPHGGRLRCLSHRPLLCMFQSTPPARGATEIAQKLGMEIEVSIHAPRTGGDNSPPGV